MSQKQYVPEPVLIDHSQKIETDKIDVNPSEEKIDHNIEGITIFCSLCKDYIAHSVTTMCEHTFCEICLHDYLLYLDECPECFAKIRHQKLSNNILLDNLIMDYIKKFEADDLEQFEKRMNQFKEFKKNKVVKDLDIGSQVDIRDQNYVWCKGRIFRLANKMTESKNPRRFVIKYEKCSKRQELIESSPRLAPKGFYTDREDIPRYEKGKLVIKNKAENVMYVLPKDADDSDSEEEQ